MKVRTNCPEGYSRNELVNIAKQCNIRLTRSLPLKGYKNMKELCEDIKKHKNPAKKGIVNENCPKGYKREELVQLSNSNNIRLTRVAPLKGYKNMIELCDELKTIKRSVKRNVKRNVKRKTIKSEDSIEKIKREYLGFIKEPYLQYNMYGIDSGYDHDDIDPVNTIKSFFRKGLRGDMIIKNKTVFQIFVDSVIKGKKHAFDDGGVEVKTIVKEMLDNGGNRIDGLPLEKFKPFKGMFDSLEKVKQEYISFIEGPYLEYNMYGPNSGYNWDILKPTEMIKSFLNKGLTADMMIKDRSVLEIYVDSIIKGSRYSLDDEGDGSEVKEIINEMLKHGNKEEIKKIIKHIENKLIKVIEVDENEYEDKYMEDYAYEKGIWVIGYLFYLFKTKMTRFYKDWNKLEPSDDTPISDIGVLQMLKHVIYFYTYKY